ncbi:hypothetical protein M0R45_009824 [Rubus argutus]|uniref:NB-ARC domain-containing protein n=1 Tax=Rubus argutus TaxID=59490 RepID=A0AAW1Y7R7_RUBAR
MEPISTAICSGIAGKIAEYSVEPIKRQVDYVIHCKSNLEKLEIELNNLTDDRRTIEERIAEATSKGGRILEQVDKWVKEVDEVTGKANQLKDERVNGCCLNLKIRHQLSRKSIQLVENVVRLRNKEFPEISSGYHREEVCSISTGDYMPFYSRESAVEQVMDELKNPNTVQIGVCGIGGVGKTTLVKEVFRKAKQDTNLFDKVAILFDVKSIQDLEVIQKQIVEKLGMDLLVGETMVNRASRLCGYIKGKKILIILDDVQTKIDLEQLGVPGVATCKVLHTSRIPISGMSPDKGFKLGILPEEEAWELFENKADVLHKDPAIQTVAKHVAKKCGGLPVLVVTVASSLKDKTRLYSWDNALRSLKEFDHKDKSPEKEAHSTIEWSYNQLDDSMLKDLFLLCGTTVRGNRICLEDLFRYSMGLSVFKNVHTLEHARNAFYSKVDELKDFCLLIDGEADTSVRMHDIVRDTARHIALRDHHMLSAMEDGGDDQSDGKGWPNNELTEKCTTISFPSANNIPEVLQCPALKMFLLQGNDRDDDSLKFLPEFFNETKQLRVLSLGEMLIPSLPSSLQFLSKLQTLCLHECSLEDLSLVGQLNNLEILSLEGSYVKQLPKEIGQLTGLRLLDLSNCYWLEVVSPGVISSLTRLEELRMRRSFKNWKAAGDGSNAGLFELKDLSQLTALEVHVPNADILPADFFLMS